MSSIRGELAALNDTLSTDDAPLWAEVVGTVLVFGFLYRNASHVLAALLAGVDPHVADNDVTAANAVATVRERGLVMIDFYGRLFALGFGILWLHVFDPANTWLYVGAGGEIFKLAVIANIAVCLTDPALFAYNQLKITVISNGN